MDLISLNKDGVFYTFQGEGIATIGQPTIFVRLHFCNLHCKWKGGKICDAHYSWQPKYIREMEKISIDNLIKRIIKKMKDKKCKRIVWTGGEPAMQAFRIIQVCQKIKKKTGYFPFNEIETNGTINTNYAFFDQINCSPKLTSSGNEKKLAYKKDVLKKINIHKNSWFKFVVVNKKDVKEIKKIATEIGIKKEKIVLMPEGVDNKTLDKRLKWIAKIALENGYNVSDRLQIRMFGNKRGT